jgi:hypothetical protein
MWKGKKLMGREMSNRHALSRQRLAQLTHERQRLRIVPVNAQCANLPPLYQFLGLAHRFLRIMYERICS